MRLQSTARRAVSAKLQVARSITRIVARASGAALLAGLLAHCGTAPGPGPTPAQIARRTRNVEVGSFPADGGRQLAYVAHRPARMNPRRAAFIYVHGIESHSAWFDDAAARLAASGYPVFSLDRRGSGINQRNRGFVPGHVERGVELVDDIHRAVEQMRSTGKFGPIYLIGLSWGGKYAVAYDTAYPREVDGLVLITPGIKPKVDLNASEKLAVFVDAIFAPERQHRIPIQAEMFTTTPRYLDYIKNDPLKLRTVSAGFLRQSVKFDRMVERKDDRVHPPMLVFLAGHDRIIDNAATREYLAQDPRRPVEIIEYADQTHSIQLEAPDRLARDILEWTRKLPHRN